MKDVPVNDSRQDQERVTFHHKLCYNPERTLARLPEGPKLEERTTGHPVEEKKQA